MTIAADPPRLDPRSAAATGSPRAVALWLIACCLTILAIVVVGGITRLTESGLSIMEWAPLTGALPPLGAAEWQRVFDLYRAIPQYDSLNAGMTLAEFKGIFWWEWAHRQLARAAGLVFAVPFLWFLIRRQIPAGLTPHLLALLALGALQGAVGWFMVASGFFEPVSVSQYRLTLHLGLALIIYSYALWLAFGLLRPEPQPMASATAAALRRRLLALLGLAGLTIGFGGFVAGLDAGFIYNTFPTMNGRLVPAEFLATSPAWRDVFENPASAQFIHRCLAIATVAAALWIWIDGRRRDLPDAARRALAGLVLMALAQAALGVSTLLLVVPIPLAAAHQAGAVALLSTLLWALHVVRGAAGAQAAGTRAMASGR